MPSARAAATPGAMWSSSSVPKRPFSPQWGLMPATAIRGFAMPMRLRSACPPPTAPRTPPRAARLAGRAWAVEARLPRAARRQNALGRQPLDRLLERDVRRDVDDLEPL